MSKETREAGEAVTNAPVTPRLIFDSAAAPVIQEPIRVEIGENPKKITATSFDRIDNVEEPEYGNADAAPDAAESGDISMPIKATDLDKLSVEELRHQQEEIDRKIRQKEQAERKAVIGQILDVVNTYKITVEEIVEAMGGIKIKRKGVKAKPKYQDPDTGAIWTGRGKEPAWIKGKDRKPFLIDGAGDE